MWIRCLRNQTSWVDRSTTRRLHMLYGVWLRYVVLLIWDLLAQNSLGLIIGRMESLIKKGLIVSGRIWSGSTSFHIQRCSTWLVYSDHHPFLISWERVSLHAPQCKPFKIETVLGNGKRWLGAGFSNLCQMNSMVEKWSVWEHCFPEEEVLCAAPWNPMAMLSRPTTLYNV